MRRVMNAVPQTRASLGKGRRWRGACIDAVPAAGADRSMLPEAPNRSGPQNAGRIPAPMRSQLPSLDAASRTIPPPCRLRRADVQVLVPSRSLPWSPPHRPLPRRPATISAARRATRLAPAARAPPHPPRRGRDRRAQTAGAAPPDRAPSLARRRSWPSLIGRAPPPAAPPNQCRGLPPGSWRGGATAGNGPGGAPPPAAGLDLIAPPRPQLKLPGLPQNPSNPRSGPLSRAWKVQVLTPRNPLSPPILAWQGLGRIAGGELRVEMRGAY